MRIKNIDTNIFMYLYTYTTVLHPWAARRCTRLPWGLSRQGSVSGGTWCSSVVMFAMPWLGSAHVLEV